MDIRKIKKRDGRVVDFDRSKIENAVAKAFRASGEVDAEHVEGVSEAIVILLLSGMRGSSAAAVDTMSAESTDVGGEESIPTVEEIQDSVEAALMKSGYPETAKAYILYRSQHGKARKAKKTLLDYKKLIEGYTGANKDWRVKENSTVTLSVGGLILSNSGAVTANYWLSEVYDEDIAQAHRQCYLHLHDLSMLTPYCAGWSLKQLIQEGLGGVPGKISSAPAKHLSTLCNQMVNFLGILQNEWAGAQAFSSFDTYLAPFVRADHLTYQEVKQCIQSFIYGVNTPSRWGCVPPSTEILTEEGWKHYNDLKKGEGIYTWNDGTLELCPLNEVVVKEHNGVLHQYRARGYNQTVTPDHRVLCKKHNLGQYVIRRSEDIFSVKTPYYLPVRFHGCNITAREKGITEAEAVFAAIVYTDGSIDMRGGSVHKVCIYKSPNREGNEEIEELSGILGFKFTRKELTGGFGSPVNKYTFYGDSARAIIELVGTTKKSIHPKFTRMSADCSELFLATWSRYDGRDEKFMLQYDNDDIADALQHIAVRAGYTSFKYHSGKADYVKIRKTENVQTAARTEIPYEGIVWCPNDDNGTAVFRSADGEVFISGQCQAPFTNVTLDWTCPPDMKDLPAIVGGKEMDFTYGDCKKEMDMVNKAFIEIMLEGDANGRGFQYPIPTYSITKDFDWGDTENNRLLFEMTAKYGTPYYSNYVNSDMKPSDIRSLCCRLRLDLRELRKKGGGFFGSGESTGSVGVVTLNLPRLAYLSGSEEDFYVMLDHYMDLAARSLKIKRRTITGLMEGGLYPYTKRYLGTFENHFSTIGIVGMNEAIENASWLDGDITGEEGHQFALDVLNHMRDRLSDYQEQYGDLYNLEATPAESTTYRFAKHDVEEFPDIITAEKNGGAPFYTNSTHLPVGFTDDIFDALELEDDMQVLYTSGTVFHGFLGQELRDWKAARDLVRKIAENFRLPYYTLTPTYSVCAIHGYIPGKHFTCPECGREAEVYSRITGYYRPLRNWNDGKASEFRERVTYAEDRLDGLVTGTVKGGAQDGTVETTGGPETAKEPAVLVATRTCPNCKAAKKMLDNAGISYRVIFADTDPGMMYADSLGIMQAPALVVETSSSSADCGPVPGKGTRVYEGIGMIAGYIKGQPPRVSE